MMRFISAVLAIGLFFSVDARAYLPPSAFMVKTMVAKRLGFKGVRIRSMVTGAESDKKTRFREVVLVDFVSQTVRSWAYDDTGKLLYAAERKATETGENQYKLPGSVLFCPDFDRVSTALIAAGIPVRTEAELLAMKDEEERRKSEVTWLGRLKENTAWVIGPQGLKGQSQLWILKDSFLPIRLDYAATDSSFYDVLFDNYRFYKEFPFPRVTIINNDEGEQLLKAEVSDVTINPDMAEFKQKFSSGYTDAGNSADSSIRDLMKLYYQVVR